MSRVLLFKSPEGIGFEASGKNILWCSKKRYMWPPCTRNERPACSTTGRAHGVLSSSGLTAEGFELRVLGASESG